jgi:DNA replication licensing factor MCM2
MKKYLLKLWATSSKFPYHPTYNRATTLQDWLLHPPVRRTIAREFRTFLLEYTNEVGESVYGARINNLGERNLESLEVNYGHLRNTRATVAKFLVQCPNEVLKVLLHRNLTNSDI